MDRDMVYVLLNGWCSVHSRSTLETGISSWDIYLQEGVFTLIVPASSGRFDKSHGGIFPKYRV